MGRHRRSAPPTPESIGAPPGDVRPAAPPVAEATARPRGRRAARGRRTVPLRTGLLGASAAVAMGTVAVASGLLPGGDRFEPGGGGLGERVRADSLPDAAPQDGGATASAGPTADPAGRGTGRPSAPETGRPSSAAAPSTTPSPRQPSQPSAGTAGAHRPATPATPAAPQRASHPPKAADGGSSAEAQVLSLVNQERAQAGCSPVTANHELGGLARQFSDDMARRQFFDHTDPDGASPWDRARHRGIGDLGGENIARGQADARSVMETWMNSPGHRANILNCEYRTLGVGAHFGPGGPWWTQEFGF
ncbi:MULTISPECIES: CAP domain-containing protein [Streptomyces]|uniref:CAP domain-containing protein n=1 Tax=Streptomyces TaxID=1883 RepID=UPI000B9E9185|nr:CAP domain-containing protein [Streptomyces kasugaensis]